MSAKIRLLFAAFIVAAALTAGCANGGGPQPTLPAAEQSQPASLAPSGAETMRLTVYYATKDAMYLVPEAQVVPKSEHPAQSALELLIQGPKNQELEKVFPEGTKLRRITIKDHVAYPDFNDTLVKNNGGGSTSEILTVAAIVNTLTEFPDIHKVQILVEGKKIDTISGHLDLSEPLSRSEKIIKKN